MTRGVVSPSVILRLQSIIKVERMDYRLNFNDTFYKGMELL